MVFAVHISDGVLEPIWLLIGAGVGLAFVVLGSRGIRDEEIPHIGLLGAAFFVASLIHVRLGPTSVHLLLNGLVGLLLGARCALSIGVGLLLQSILLGHGGFYVLGVNACVMILPALLARPVFRRMMRPEGSSGSVLVPGSMAVGYLLHPSGAVVVWLFLRSIRYLVALVRVGREFRAGWVLGFGSVTLTALFNSLVLAFAGAEDWRLVAGLNFLAHLPVAMLEGLILGSVTTFLAKVKPELLPWGAEGQFVRTGEDTRGDYKRPLGQLVGEK